MGADRYRVTGEVTGDGGENWNGQRTEMGIAHQSDDDTRSASQYAGMARENERRGGGQSRSS